MFKLTFVIPVPTSSKNRQRIMTNGSKRWIAKSREADRQVGPIQRAAVAALAAQGMTMAPGGESLFGDDSVSVLMEHDVAADTLRVTIWSLGPRPKGKTGRKRDLQNLQDGVLDALQGIVYDNDNQLDSLQMKRKL